MKKINLEENHGQEAEKLQPAKNELNPGSRKRKFKIILAVLGFLLIMLLVLGGSLAFLARDLLKEKEPLLNNVDQIKLAVKEQNLGKIEASLLSTKESLVKIEGKIGKISWMEKLPLLGNYVADLNHGVKSGVAGLEAGELVVNALVPYADILGFSGADAATASGKTTMDRITFIVMTLDKIRPQFEEVSRKLKIVEEELAQVDANRYPESLAGRKIRSMIVAVKVGADQAAVLLTDAKPLLEELPKLLGMDQERYYLVIFQNDAELRPTGGFMTAYGVLKVSQGKITPVLSQDIYAIDNRLSRTEPAPEVLINYLKLPYGQEAKAGKIPQWRVRDMNLSPDFAVSMEKFYEYYKKVAGSGNLNGILGVDTKVLVNLLKIIGAVGVPEWGNFSAETDKRCDCPQVVYRLEELADKPISGTNLARKAVIGPLMHSVLLNAFQSPKTKMPLLLEEGLKSIREKHLLVYLFDEKSQKAVEAFNLGGRIKDYEGDYFHLSDTSFSGAKSNLFIKQAIEQKIEVDAGGTITKTVSITYKNPAPASNCNLEKGDLCLNAPYRDWVRIYVPKGSTLESTNGFETEIETSEELGKTVFAGFFGDKYPLRPQSTAKVVFKYKLPFTYKKGEEYKLLIQKQPGVESYDYLLDFNGQKEEFELRTDKEVKF